MWAYTRSVKPGSAWPRYSASSFTETPPERPALVARKRAQWLVNRAARGARYVFIGPNVGLVSPARHVQFLPSYHDNHLHLRIYP